ncbi:NAD-dependent deacetylase sirtuin-2 [Basidiobolus meristosporus CBS 931.73]|uniref:NAD-dependent protein deacetylase n=1 Tax=Basidiobolus meristosporus CBS 931.73 TaxID=1314790 RepID=A0A1Y1YDF8_9FUNG|nr:NAD-dependent deacetylase sirtuin-2 [Basidiobolus meristosporus CBS 931.73]|eukprot:ORX95766.1 NAD-dependent deacetylase sirtuin-2 [Basidiobolus meristosporus CBS 931.73]
MSFESFHPTAEAISSDSPAFKSEYSIDPQSPDSRIITSPTLESFVEYIKTHEIKNIVVLSGAGISTAAGIPDFRTPGTGLYDNLQKFDLPEPEDIFDIEYFHENPLPFYTLAKELYPGNFEPTLTHCFIRFLHEKGLLLRNFTQNIDTLERECGLPEAKIVEAHGSFYTAHCTSPSCSREYQQDWMKEKIFNSEVPKCQSCDALIKPDITFFGETLPKIYHERIEEDFDHCELLIVIGTSLKVQPFASLIDRVANNVPRLLINRQLSGVQTDPSLQTYLGFDFEGTHQPFQRDALFLGTADEGCLKMMELLGWKAEFFTFFEKEARHWKASYSDIPATVPAALEEQETEGITKSLERITLKV